ncbi:MAG: hypothetical protein WA982_16905 [Rubrobacteraceae bacterium]
MAGRILRTEVDMSRTPTHTAPVVSRSMAIGAIAGLAVLKVVMLAALFTQTPPYPPLAFAPLFGASLALSAFVVAMIYARSRWFVLPTGLIVLESLLSYGPQKLYPGESSFFAQTTAVYPAILVGSALILVLALSSWRLSQAFASKKA